MILPYRDHKFAAAKTAVERIMMEMNEAATGKIPWPTMAAELIDGAVISAIEKVAGPRMAVKNRALLAVKVRVAMMGPNEPKWEGYPDWRHELRLVEEATGDSTYDQYVRLADVEELFGVVETVLKGVKETTQDEDQTSRVNKCLERIKEFRDNGPRKTT